MEALRPAEVFLHREQERAVARELGELPLRHVVELAVVGELVEEVRQPAVVRHGRHLQEDAARVGVLRDRLEGLELLEPQTEHRKFTTPAQTGWIRPDSGIVEAVIPADSHHLGQSPAAMQIGDEVIYRGRLVRLLGLEPMSVPDRRAQVEDRETGEPFAVAYDELEEPWPSSQGFDPAA